MPRPMTSNRRPDDWPERLAAFLESCQDKPFVWGVHDCCTLAADAAQALIGIDPLGALRGAWTTEAEAEAMLAARGGLEAAVRAQAAAVGLPECPPAFAQRGDVVIVQVDNQAVTGVVAGAKVAVPGIDRLRMVPRELISAAWVI